MQSKLANPVRLFLWPFGIILTFRIPFSLLSSLHSLSLADRRLRQCITVFPSIDSISWLARQIWIVGTHRAWYHYCNVVLSASPRRVSWTCILAVLFISQAHFVGSMVFVLWWVWTVALCRSSKCTRGSRVYLLCPDCPRFNGKFPGCHADFYQGGTWYKSIY